MTHEDTLREDFNIFWKKFNNKEGVVAYPNYEEICDFFLSKLAERERELKDKIKKLKVLGTYAVYSDERYHQDSYNQALSDILTLLETKE